MTNKPKTLLSLRPLRAPRALNRPRPWPNPPRRPIRAIKPSSRRLRNHSHRVLLGPRGNGFSETQSECPADIIMPLCGQTNHLSVPLADGPSFTIPQRRMSVSEINTALRPFYFAVHPDLFGKFPDQRVSRVNSRLIHCRCCCPSSTVGHVTHGCG